MASPNIAVTNLTSYNNTMNVTGYFNITYSDPTNSPDYYSYDGYYWFGFYWFYVFLAALFILCGIFSILRVAVLRYRSSQLQRRQARSRAPTQNDVELSSNGVSPNNMAVVFNNVPKDVDLPPSYNDAVLSKNAEQYL